MNRILALLLIISFPAFAQNLNGNVIPPATNINQIGGLGTNVLSSLTIPTYATTPAANALLTGAMIGTSGGVLCLLNSNCTFSGPGVNILNTTGFSVSLTGNAITNYSDFNVQSTTSHNGTSEALVSLGFINNLGGGSPAAGTGNKETLYIGHVMQSPATAGWAVNPLITVSSGTIGAGFWGATVSEFDFNNNDGHDQGNYAGAFNPAQPCNGASTYNQCYFGELTVTGFGLNKIDYGILVSGYLQGGGAQLNRGIVVNSAIQHAFEDASSATTSFALYGTHTYGLDFNGGTFSAGSIRLGNVGVVSARNAANSADIQLMYLDSGNNFQIMPGASSTGFVVIGQYSAGLVPGVSGTLALGNSTNKWGSAYVTDLYANDASALIHSSVTLNNGSGASAGTLTNAPAAGNPTKWISIDDNGTTRKIPAW